MQYSNLFLVLSVTVLGLTIGSCNFSQENDILPKTDSQVNTKIIDVENISNSQIDSLIDLKRANKLTETAKFLAGIEIKPTSRLNKLKYESNWLEHHRFFAHSWSKLETEHLAEVRQWTRENLAEINNTDYSIFYPFSSADLLYAYSLFPQAREYILIDSKPIGTIPDLQNNSIVKIKEELQEVRDTLYPLFEFGFSSSDMPKIELDDRGVLPILLVFIARTNSRILDLEYINLESQANVSLFCQSPRFPINKRFSNATISIR